MRAFHELPVSRQLASLLICSTLFLRSRDQRRTNSPAAPWNTWRRRKIADTNELQSNASRETEAITVSGAKIMNTAIPTTDSSPEKLVPSSGGGDANNSGIATMTSAAIAASALLNAKRDRVSPSRGFGPNQMFQDRVGLFDRSLESARATTTSSSTTTITVHELICAASHLARHTAANQFTFAEIFGLQVQRPAKRLPANAAV